MLCLIIIVLMILSLDEGVMTKSVDKSDIYHSHAHDDEGWPIWGRYDLGDGKTIKNG